ncbi:MAG: T9SS type A sorting domain-containing protein [Bacteroidetes bacterium]|nr:T9SS type A sorting domain-containing protein [Bacteroidota bacterium]
MATHGAGVYSANQTLVSVEDELGIPTNYTLSQNYPNPFNPSTTINFSLPQTGNVQLTLFDALGRKVKDIVNKVFSVGNHSVNFNASSATGGLSSGVYFYRLQADNFVQTKKMILLR